jgi:hypothetical protein
MKNKIIASIAALLLVSLSLSQAQTTIVAWTFENDPVLAPTFNPAPSTFNGSGTESAASIGMAGTPTPSAGTNDPDVLLGASGDTGANGITNYTHVWRIRAQKAGNGWYSGAAIGTQGAEFAVDTTGFNNINVRFDWYATTQGEGNLQLQYTDDGVTWINVPINVPAAESELASNYNNGSDANTVTGYYVSNNVQNNALDGQDWFTNLTATISDPNAAYNPNFAIEIVNASTGPDCIATTGNALNNSSGNWRFDNVVISGTPGVGGPATPPTLTPAAGVSVTNTTFAIAIPAGNTAWQRAITNITFNGVALLTSAFTNGVAISSSSITFSNVSAAVFQTSGTFNIVIAASGYSGDTVSQVITPGPATQMVITTQPVAPTGDGGTLVAQPTLEFEDLYGNVATNVTANVAATVGSGSWNFGVGSGTNQVAVAGVVNFTNLSATSVGAVSGATITFTASGSGLGSLASTTTNSSAFNISAPSTAFTQGNLAVLQEDVDANNSTFSMLELNPSIANQSSPVNTFPITATGTNAMRMSSAATTGRLADSDDGTLVCFSGFEDSSSLTADETTINPRGVGTFNAPGNYVLQTSYIGNGGAGNQARSATTFDDTNFYAGDKGGIYVNNGTTPFIGGSEQNVRSLKTFGGTLYALQQEGSTVPTDVMLQIIPDINGNINYNGVTAETGYASYWPVSGFPQETNVLDFYMVKSGNNGGIYDVVYYIDGTNSTSGAIYKYYYSGTDPNNSALPQFTLAGYWNTTNGGDGLCAALNTNGGFDLYYTTGSGGLQNNSVIAVHDSAAWNQPPDLTSTNILYTAPGQTTLKGVAFAPDFPPTAPTVSTLTASNITAGSATLDGTVNPNNLATACWFIYGTDNTVSLTNLTTTNFLGGIYSTATITNLISGLLPNTTYYYYIAATNNDGLSLGVTNSFTTAAPAVTVPTVTTLVASNITASSAALNATVNPNGGSTAYWFQYGTNASYGSFTATNTLPTGSSPASVTNLINGLLQGTVYHYQIVATNIAGASPGADANFITLAVTPPQLVGVALSGGAFKFSFTNATGASFSVLATNNISAPLTNWPVVGQAVENPAGSGNYQFTNLPATNAQQFYILRQP